MELTEIKLYNVKIDEKFILKENKYRALCKVDNEGITNIIMLELSEAQYESISATDYTKKIYSIKGNMKITKNKKDIPYVIFTANYIDTNSNIKKIQNNCKRVKRRNIINSYNRNKKRELEAMEIEVNK